MEGSFSNSSGTLRDSEPRRHLYTLITQHAGIHFREVGRKSGLSTAVVKHHLDALVRRGAIRTEVDGRNLRYYPLSIDTRNRALLGLLRQEGIRRVLLSVLGHTRSTFSEVVADTCLAPATVSAHLTKLRAAGVVVTVGVGSRSQFIIVADEERLRKLLHEYRGSFLDGLVDRLIDSWDF